jgi:hypothetical protein
MALMRSAPGSRESNPRPLAIDSPCEWDDRNPVEDPTLTRACHLASFLSAEYGLDTIEQGMFIAELSVEMTLRMAEGPLGG